jgi:hypothetical protein
MSDAPTFDRYVLFGVKPERGLGAYTDQELGQIAAHLRAAERSLAMALHMASLPHGCDALRWQIRQAEVDASILLGRIAEHRARA